MRPAGRAETESLYFTYPTFAAPSPSHREDLATPVPVAVVGAGPVGMTAALALARQGIRTVLFDNKNSFNDGSRAICIARASYHLLDRLGVADPFLAKALGWTTGRSFYRGEQILEFQMPDSAEERFRPMYNLQQQYIEQFLWDAVAANDLIEVRWQSEVTSIADTEGGVRLGVSDPNQSYEIEAEWVLACDGARSSLRAMRGLRLQGENFEGRYVIADIQMAHDYPTIRRALFDPACRPGGTVLIHKQPDDIWRIDYQLRADESTEEALLEARVRDTVASVLAEVGHDGDWELEWWSVYSANTLALEEYRHGRVFFAGDSAHIVPIFGVRGLNNGLADAVNIGWKLGWVLNGRAGPALLDSYSPERRGATLDVFANASKSTRFMTPNSHGWKLMRDAALSLALTEPFAGELANPRQFAAYVYDDSPAVLEEDPDFSGGPVAGEMLAEVKLEDGYLSERLGAGFTVLCFDAELAREIERGRAEGEDVEVVTLPHPSAAASRFMAARRSAYLIRPDMHIAGRWHAASADAVLAGFRSITAGEGAGQ